MRYSGKLNGFWEEGYHYYIEIDKKKMTVRDYARRVTLTTEISYDAAALERGERTQILLKDKSLSKCADGSDMMAINALYFEDGELKLTEYHAIVGEKLLTLKKVDHGPFDHVINRDREYMRRLQGVWEQWTRSGEGGEPLEIRGDRLRWLGEVQPFSVVSYRTDPHRVYIVPKDLTQRDFAGFTPIEILPDMLTTRMIIMDMSVPLTVFARKDMLDKISVPPAALEEARNTMIAPVDVPPAAVEPPLRREPEIRETVKKIK